MPRRCDSPGLGGIPSSVMNDLGLVSTSFPFLADLRIDARNARALRVSVVGLIINRHLRSCHCGCKTKPTLTNL